MKAALLAILLAAPAAAGELGGHEPPRAARGEPGSADGRRAVLEEMWQRRLLPPDQSAWSPGDYELLLKIRRVQDEAIDLLSRRFGGSRPWTARPRSGGPSARRLLTKEGYEKYLFTLTQDAVSYFESKGVGAKRVFKLRDMDDAPLFDARGRITDDGARVYRLARLNQEVFWKSPAGEVYGTRRPPANKP